MARDAAVYGTLLSNDELILLEFEAISQKIIHGAPLNIAMTVDFLCYARRKLHPLSKQANSRVADCLSVKALELLEDLVLRFHHKFHLLETAVLLSLLPIIKSKQKSDEVLRIVILNPSFTGLLGSLPNETVLPLSAACRYVLNLTHILTLQQFPNELYQPVSELLVRLIVDAVSKKDLCLISDLCDAIIQFPQRDTIMLAVFKALNSQDLVTGSPDGTLVACFHLLVKRPDADTLEWLLTVVLYASKSAQTFVRKCAYTVLRKLIDVGCLEPSKQWMDYILILEAIEENQYHIILPYLSAFEQLFRSRHISLRWLLLILGQALKHPNAEISEWACLQCATRLRLAPFGNSKADAACFIEFVATECVELFSRFDVLFRFVQSQGLDQFFAAWFAFFQQFDEPEVAGNLLRLLLNRFLNEHFTPVQIFCVSLLMTSLPKSPLWTPADVPSFRKLLWKCSLIPYVSIRQKIAANLCELAIKHCCLNDDGGITAGERLLSLFSTEVFRRKSVEMACTQHLNSADNAFLQARCDETKAMLETVADSLLWQDVCGRVRMLFLSLRPIDDSLFTFLAQKLGQLLRGSESRSYMDCTAPHILMYALLELKKLRYEHDFDLSSWPTVDLINFISRRILFELKSVHDSDVVDLYCQVLAVQSGEKFGHNIRSMVRSCVQAYLTSESSVCRCLLLQFIAQCVSCLSFEQELYDSFLALVRALDFGEEVSKTAEANLDLAVWGNFLSNYSVNRWRCVQWVLTGTDNVESLVDLVKLADQLVENFSTLQAQDLTPLYSCVKLLVPSLIDHKLSIMLVKAAFVTAFEQKKSDLFLPTVSAWIDAVVTAPVLGLSKLSTLQQDVLQNLQLLLKEAEANQAVAFCLAKQFYREINENVTHTIAGFGDVLIALAIFGSSFTKKDLVTIDSITEYIAQLGDDRYDDQSKIWRLSSRQCYQLTRVFAIGCLLRIVPVDCDFATFCVNKLMTLAVDSCQGKTRYYERSETHRIKNRCNQILLIVSPFLNQAQAQVLYDFCISEFIRMGQQPSVRVLLEWIVAKLCLQYPSLISDLLVKESSMATGRQGSIGSWLTICLHVALQVEVFTDQYALLIELLPRFLAWTSTQHFTVRVIAQTVLRKVWLYCERNPDRFGGFLEKFSFIGSVVKLECRNAVRNVEELLTNDFYFALFDPVRDFSLESVFYLVPRLTNCLAEDMISAELFVEHLALHSSIKVLNITEDLRLWRPMSESVVSQTDQDQAELVETDLNQLQKKYTVALPHELRALDAKPGAELILVASLVTLATNLGGLCRTCEIFGVQQMIVGNMRIVQDPQFQGLSVSAENWISLQEVNMYNLMSYLTEKQLEGYTLIGLEQTTNSISLHSYVFPQRSVLLLGSERNGIPAELVAKMNVCVEIPQFGVVRSLNVHVSGALCIWEWAKQSH